MMPSEKTSEERVAVRVPDVSSWAMYCGVPKMTPVSVRGALGVRGGRFDPGADTGSVFGSISIGTPFASTAVCSPVGAGSYSRSTNPFSRSEIFTGGGADEFSPATGSESISASRMRADDARVPSGWRLEMPKSVIFTSGFRPSSPRESSTFPGFKSRMDDARGMDRVEPLRDLREHAERPRYVPTAAPHVVEGAARHELHHEEDVARLRDVDVDDGDDVRMIHARNDLRLASEPRSLLGIAAGRERLQREVLAVGRALHLVHRAHAAAADGFDHTIAILDDDSGRELWRLGDPRFAFTHQLLGKLLRARRYLTSELVVQEHHFAVLGFLRLHPRLELTDERVGMLESEEVLATEGDGLVERDARDAEARRSDATRQLALPEPREHVGHAEQHRPGPGEGDAVENGMRPHARASQSNDEDDLRDRGGDRDRHDDRREHEHRVEGIPRDDDGDDDHDHECDPPGAARPRRIDVGAREVHRGERAEHERNEHERRLVDTEHRLREAEKERGIGRSRDGSDREPSVAKRRRLRNVK